MKFKICTKCNKSLHISKFSFRRGRAKGRKPYKIRYSICKGCNNSSAYQRQKDNPLIYMISHARRRSKELRLPFDITPNDIVIPSHCPVFGLKLEFCSCPNKQNCNFEHDTYPTLDRIVNSLGYVKGNCAIISWRANRLKGDGTAEDHQRIAKYMEDYL